MLLNILLVFHILVCVLLIVTVLMQQSEGGALGMGGGPSGFMTARGAGNLLTRITWILFSLFLVLSIGLTILAAAERGSSSLTGGVQGVDPNSIVRPLPTAPQAPAEGGAAPLPTAPLPATGLPTAPLPGAAPATAPSPAPAQ